MPLYECSQCRAAVVVVAESLKDLSLNDQAAKLGDVTIIRNCTHSDAPVILNLTATATGDSSTGAS